MIAIRGLFTRLVQRSAALGRPSVYANGCGVIRLLSSSPPSTIQSSLLASALAGDSRAQFQYALQLQAEAPAVDTSPIAEDTPASCREEVLKEVKVVQTKARKSKKAAIKRRKAGVLENMPVELTEGSDEQSTPDFWLRKAYDGGLLDAGVALANRLVNEGSHAGIVEAVELYEDAVEEGHPDACFNLGNLYFQGSTSGGIQMDMQKSLVYFKKGAEVNDSSSLYWLGHCYYSGEGGVEDIDMDAAVTYLSRAAAMQHPAAHYYLSLIFRSRVRNGDSDSNMELFRQHLQDAYDLGDADAAFCLAEVLMTGSDGYSMDLLRARDMLVEAVDRGHAEAAASLGALYYKGAMVPEDKRKAFDLYTLAADRGCQDAWKNIAAMYATGEGVKKCEETAKYIMKTVFPK